MKKSSRYLLMVFFCLFLFSNYGLNSQTTTRKIIQIAKVTVPSLVGKTLVEAEKLLKKNGLLYQKSFIMAVTSQYHGQEGKVVKQSPEAGKKVAKKIKVWIYIYSPKKKTEQRITTIKRTALRILRNDLVWKKRFSFLLKGGTSPTIVATIKNYGKDATPSGIPLEFEVILFDEKGKTIYSKLAKSNYPLGGGSTYPTVFQYISGTVYKNTYWIQLMVDPANKIRETNEKNNLIKKRNLPDLAIKRIWIKDEGSKYKIMADVENIGPGPVPGKFPVTWYLDGQKKTPFLGNLGPYAYDFSYSLNKSSFPVDKKTLTVKLHVSDSAAYSYLKPMEELRLDNNIFQITLIFPDR